MCCGIMIGEFDLIDLPYADPYLLKELRQVFTDQHPEVVRVTRNNVEEVIELSENYRISIHGERGRLT